MSAEGQRRRVRRAGATLVVGLAALSTACSVSSEYVESIARIDVKRVLLSTQGPNGFTETINLGYRTGWTMLGGLLVILCFYLWFLAQQGRPWTELLREGLGWSVLCVALMGSPVGPGVGGAPEWIYRLFVEIGEIFAPVGGATGAHELSAREALSRFVVRLQGVGPPPNPGAGDASPLVQLVQAQQFMSVHPLAVAGTMVNAALLPSLRFLMNVSWAVLVMFYWVITPLVLPTMILPSTRGIFVGWVKAYVSVCLWPLFFHLLERFAAVLPWGDWAGTERAVALVSSASPTLPQIMEAVGYWTRGQLVIGMLNLTFILMYLAVPVISGRLVSGSVGAVKAGFF